MNIFLEEEEEEDTNDSFDYKMEVDVHNVHVMEEIVDVVVVHNNRVEVVGEVDEYGNLEVVEEVGLDDCGTAAADAVVVVADDDALLFLPLYLFHLLILLE